MQGRQISLSDFFKRESKRSIQGFARGTMQEMLRCLVNTGIRALQRHARILGALKHFLSSTIQLTLLRPHFPLNVGIL